MFDVLLKITQYSAIIKTLFLRLSMVMEGGRDIGKKNFLEDIILIKSISKFSFKFKNYLICMSILKQIKY